MDQSKPGDERRSPRSKLLMAAILEHRGGSMKVKLRDLSTDGALVEGDDCPLAGSRVVFRKNELALPGRIVWSQDGRAGIAFDAGLDPEAVLRHVPPTTPLRNAVHKGRGCAPGCRPKTALRRNASTAGRCLPPKNSFV